MVFSSGGFDNGFGATNATPGSMFGGVKPSKAGAVYQDFLLSLEELYTGCIKRVKVSRKRQVEGLNRYTNKETTLTINVQPGWRRGTKITFSGEGDESPGSVAPDLVLCVEEAAHASFERAGHNLYYTAQVSLVEALTSCTVQVNTLDGRTLSIPCNEIISPTSTKCVAGEGMPMSNRPGIYGDLIIKFDILFPGYLSLKQQQGVQQVLAQDPFKPKPKPAPKKKPAVEE